MFESLSERLSGVLRTLGKEWKLTEKNIDDSLYEVRLALLEADVHLTVVKKFVNQVKEQLIGQIVEKHLTPAQHVIKVVHDELTNLLGGKSLEFKVQNVKPSIIMMVGLQGSGKTTSTGKLAYLLKKNGMNPYLVSVDIYRPAAIEQLQILAQQLDFPCFPSNIEMKPIDIATAAISEAKSSKCDVVLLDTAGRLHIDASLMEELRELTFTIKPQEIFFVADAMTGQDIFTVVDAFNTTIPLTGAILTKMDGDSRGGAALAIHSVTGIPMRYVGIGEKPSDFEMFHPERVANRILGMGDMLTLIEKAQATFDEAEVESLTKKIQKASFNFEDFRQQMNRMKQLGSLQSVMKLIPGFGVMANKFKNMTVPEQEIKLTEVIINSMTIKERRNPSLLNNSRKQRISQGSGVSIAQVNQMVKKFETMRQMMQRVVGDSKTVNTLVSQDSLGLGGVPGIGGMAGGFPGIPGLFNRPGFKVSASSSATKKKKKERQKNKNKRKK